MTNSLNNKIALVTGASRGIGKAIALGLATKGARVAVHCAQGVDDAKETMRLCPGDGHEVFCADLRKPQQIERLVDEVYSKWGRLDVLVNNAGIYQECPPESSSFEQWEQNWRTTLETNLLGPAHLTFLVAKRMVTHGGGRVVNIGSRGAFRGEPSAVAYGASKAGLHAMGQSMAQALAGQNILFFTVAPGFVDTEMSHAVLQSPKGPDIRGQSPLGRVATTEEIAEVALFLAGDAPAFSTGCIVDVNGASHLRT